MSISHVSIDTDQTRRNALPTLREIKVPGADLKKDYRSSRMIRGVP
jgi:hypothetical protein